MSYTIKNMYIILTLLILAIVVLGIICFVLRDKNNILKNSVWQTKQEAEKQSQLQMDQWKNEERAKTEQWRNDFIKSERENLEKQLNYFRQNELQSVKDVAVKDAQVQLDKWKAEYTTIMREDAVKRSRAINSGLITEHMAPYLPGFNYNPKDAHFIGKPVDYLIYDGLDVGTLKEIIFLEVKTGKSTMNSRERQVKKIIEEHKVRYEVLKLESPKTDIIEKDGTIEILTNAKFS